MVRQPLNNFRQCTALYLIGIFFNANICRVICCVERIVFDYFQIEADILWWSVIDVHRIRLWSSFLIYNKSRVNKCSHYTIE